MKRLLSQGFTLVELLIVIALLGVIATIVIAAINPIEQANRAKDAKYKADGSQLISAIERYYAAKEQFPWVVTGDAASNDAAFGFANANHRGVGICATTGNCSAGGATSVGELIKALELKTEFQRRDFIKATTADKMLMIGKSGSGALGASESVYACFIPAASSTRTTACDAAKVYTISASDGTRTPYSGTPADCKALPATGWAALYVCIPE